MAAMTDFITHLNASRFMAQRSIFAQTVDVHAQQPQMIALPGALAPIHRDRLAAHQDDGLAAHEVVEYENVQFLKTNERVRQRHAQWVGREYDAIVQAQQALEAERRRQEMEAKSAYQRKLAEILAQKDRHAGNA